MESSNLYLIIIVTVLVYLLFGLGFALFNRQLNKAKSLVSTAVYPIVFSFIVGMGMLFFAISEI